jgi:hypothetical protein
MIKFILIILFGFCSIANAVSLEWDDNSDNEAGFVVERKTIGGNWAELGTVEANITTFTDNDVLPKTVYIYRVYAYNNDGNSTYSNEVRNKIGEEMRVLIFTSGTLNIQ